MNIKHINSIYCIASFYQFVEINDLPKLQADLKKTCLHYKLLGTILIASEGINGTVSGEKENITLFFKQLKSDLRFKNIEIKFKRFHQEELE